MLRYCFYETMSSPYKCHNKDQEVTATCFFPTTNSNSWKKIKGWWHPYASFLLPKPTKTWPCPSAVHVTWVFVRLGTSACLNANLLGDPVSKVNCLGDHRVFIKFVEQGLMSKFQVRYGVVINLGIFLSIIRVQYGQYGRNNTSKSRNSC